MCVIPREREMQKGMRDVSMQQPGSCIIACAPPSTRHCIDTELDQLWDATHGYVMC